MELTPVGNGISESGTAAECRCPPGTAQVSDAARCYKLFEQGPCEVGQYFAPVIESSSKAIV